MNWRDHTISSYGGYGHGYTTTSTDIHRVATSSGQQGFYGGMPRTERINMDLLNDQRRQRGARPMTRDEIFHAATAYNQRGIDDGLLPFLIGYGIAVVSQPDYTEQLAAPSLVPAPAADPSPVAPSTDYELPALSWGTPSLDTSD